MEYNRPAYLFNKHAETIFPSLFRRVDSIHYQPERIFTPDGDFLDINWVKVKSRKLVILSHGLEGNSRRVYILGMARVFSQAGYDVLAWNYRGCGDEMNLKSRFYHSGATDDLDTVIQHASKYNYETISLVGFSLGGNLTLKFMGESLPSTSSITRAVAISVPLDLDSSCTVLSKKENWMYAFRFLKSLKNKVRTKAKRMNLPNLEKLDSISSIREFDEWITGPLHGFKNASDYYSRCSSINFISNISSPTLIINARNDPFLSEQCFPEGIRSSYVQFLYPQYGGHVGFTLFNKNNLYWSEIMAAKFITGLEIN